MNTSTSTFKRSLFYCILALVGYQSYAQDLFFNNYQLAPFATNPGQAGTLHDAWVTTNYKSVALDLGTNLTTTQVASFYPIKLGSHRLVFSGSFYNDQVSRFFATNGTAAGTAISIQLSRQSELSFGTQISLFGTSLGSNFTTDDQFINGIFDPSAPSGEIISTTDGNKISLNNGLYFQFRDVQRHTRGFIGLSHYNATRPKISYSDGQPESLPTTYKITAGYEIFNQYNFAITPTALGISRNGEQWLQLGSQLTYKLSSGDPESYLDDETNLGFGVLYNSNQSVLLSLQFTQPKLKAALNFDLPTGNGFGAARNNAIEIALHFRISKKKENYALNYQEESIPVDHNTQLKKPEQPQEEVKTQEPIPVVEPVIEKAIPINEPNQAPALKPINTSIQKEPVKPEKKKTVEILLSQLTSEDEALLDKHVRFKINSDILTDESQAHLNLIVKIFHEHLRFTINLTGHTCSLGHETINEKLSLRRAEKVKDYLINQGLEASRINTDGHGERIPLVDNTSLEGRQTNRRVEIKIFDENE